MRILLCLLISAFYFQTNAQIITNYTTADGLINDVVNALDVDADGDLWFGTQEGISRFDGTNWTNFDQTSSPELINNTILAVSCISDGSVWFGTDFGISVYNGTDWVSYTDADGLADNRIKYIKEASDGKIWVANNDGLSIFDGTDWVSYVMSDGIPFGGLNYIDFDQQGRAWLSSPLAGILIFDGTEFTLISEDDGLVSNKVRTVEVDLQGRKWIGTGSGISVFDEDDQFIKHHEAFFELPPPDELNPVEDIKVDIHGRMWVGVYVDYLVNVGGVSQYASSTWTDYTVDEGLIGPVVRKLVIDQNNDVWVATSTGISKFSEVAVALEEDLTENKISIYPNPSSVEFTVNFDQSSIGQRFTVYDMLGNAVLTSEIDAQTLHLSREFQQGMHTLVTTDYLAKRFVIVK